MKVLPSFLQAHGTDCAWKKAHFVVSLDTSTVETGLVRIPPHGRRQTFREDLLVQGVAKR
jgi:hypothetical protein